MQLIGGVGSVGQRLFYGRAPVPLSVERPHVDGLPVDGGEEGWCLNLRGPRKSPSEGELVARNQAAPSTVLLFDLLLDEMSVGIVPIRDDADSWFHLLPPRMDGVPGQRIGPPAGVPNYGRRSSKPAVVGIRDIDPSYRTRIGVDTAVA
jgi:hypothetical protein